MEIVKEVGNDELRVVFLRDEQSTLLEALVIKDFGEEKYKKLKKYIKEKLGEEFTSIINIDGSKALAKVLSVSADLIGNTMMSDIINMEIEKVESWMNSGAIKELADKVITEGKAAKSKRRSKRSKKSKTKAKKSRSKRRRRSRRSKSS